MRRRLLVRRILALILTLVFMLIFPMVVLAADIRVTADSTSVKVGDTITLTVKVSANHIAVAYGVFIYDPALLTYISSNGGASDGYINLISVQEGGSSSLTAVINFAAIGEGEAVVDVSMENVLNYDGEILGDAQAGVSITVEPSGNNAEDFGMNTETVDLSQTGVAARNVMGTDEQMYIWRSLRNVSLPSGFIDRQVTYMGDYVGGAAIPDSEDLILLYLSEVYGENEGYYIYDDEKDILFPFLTVTSISAKFTFLWPQEGVEVPDGYEQTTLLVSDKNVPAWAKQGADGSVYLVYVRNASGETGFYLYNIEDRSLQRYQAFAEFEPESEPEPTAQPTYTPKATAEPAIAGVRDESIAKPLSAVHIALIAACVLFAVASIVFAVLYKRSVARLSKQRGKTIRIKKADI